MGAVDKNSFFGLYLARSSTFYRLGELESVVTFEQLVGKYGFGLAVVIAKAILPPPFWNHMTLEQAAQIYEAAKDDPQLQAEVWRKITHTDETFSGAMEVVENVSNEKLRSVLIKRLYNTADTFMQCARVLELDYGGRYGNLSLRKMERKASGMREKEILACYTDPKSPLYAELMIFLERSSRSFTDELRVWRITKGTALSERAYKRMQRLGSFAQWLEFYRKHADTPELKEKAHAECFRLAERVYRRLKLMEIPERAKWPHLQEFCNLRCITTSTFTERLYELEATRKYASPECLQQLREDLEAQAVQFEELAQLYHKVPELRPRLLLRLRQAYVSKLK